LETELDEGQDFSNSYERSKLAAETRVQRCGARLPVTVYRPSIVVGDSATGATPHFRGLYQIMRASYAGMLPFIPAHPEYRPDVVPVDFVARAMVEIAAAPDSEGRTFHLTAGREGRMSIGEMFDRWIERAAFHCIAIRRPIFDAAEPPGGIARRRWIRMMEHLTPYLACPAVFDRQHAEALLGPIQCPPLADYFERLVDFGIACRFDPLGERASRSKAIAGGAAA
jgi:long-chain acyl-CoA synthetase